MNTLLTLFIIVPLLALLLLTLNLLLAVHRPDEAKLDPYECGFSPVYGQTRTQFSIHFFSLSFSCCCLVRCRSVLVLLLLQNFLLFVVYV